MNQIIDLLKKRGFIIETENNQYILSDNSAKKDAKLLEDILSEYQIGFLSKSSEIILTSSDATRLQKLFSPIKSGTVGVGSCNQLQPWHKVAKRNCADKIPLDWLEANIARYIKALSACGIYTGGCCDGNHTDHNNDKLYIEFDEPIYSEFHKLLWKYHLCKMFNLNWNSQYTKIPLSENRISQHEELNKAAEYIYDNRVLIRYIRKKAAKNLTKKFVESHSSDEIKSDFLANLETILKKEDLLWK